MANVHIDSWNFAFSLNKQADVGTTISDAQINKMRATQNRAPITVERNRISDDTWAGKGHSFATFNETVQERYVIGSQTRAASDLELAHALAMVMGAVSSTNPGVQDRWDHTFTFQDIQTAQEKIYTTMVEEWAGGTSPGYRRKLIGAAINSLTISAPVSARDNFVVLSWQGMAREYVDASGFTMPSLSSASFFKPGFITLSFGEVGAASDFSANVISAELTINGPAIPKNRAGAAAGEENLMTRIDVGRQSISGSITFDLSDTLRTLLLDDNDLEATWTLNSEDTVPTEGSTKTLTITLPKLKVGGGEGFGEEDLTETYTLNFDEGSILKPTGSEPLTAVLVSDIDDTELLVQNP